MGFKLCSGFSSAWSSGLSSPQGSRFQLYFGFGCQALLRVRGLNSTSGLGSAPNSGFKLKLGFKLNLGFRVQIPVRVWDSSSFQGFGLKVIWSSGVKLCFGFASKLCSGFWVQELVQMQVSNSTQGSGVMLHSGFRVTAAVKVLGSSSTWGSGFLHSNRVNWIRLRLMSWILE